MRATLPILLVLLLGCGSGGAPAPVAAPDFPVIKPAIALKGETDGAFEVSGFSKGTQQGLAKFNEMPEVWPDIFSVRVDGAAADVPALLGTYEYKDDAIRFTPRFPLRRGVRYRAAFSPQALPAVRGEFYEPVERTFELPRPPSVPTTVTQVYPTADTLPENQLKFYIHFSAPMSRQEAYDRIRLLGPDGKPIEHGFVQVPEGLWDRDGRRFTLILHPGRVKRGLKPREELGPILEEGKSYVLEVDKAWSDGEGMPLKETFKKAFRALAPDDTQPDPKTWKLNAPAAGTTEPLVVTFPEPLDQALLEDVVWVADGAGEAVEGKVTLEGNETRWHFTPKAPWRAGAYRLVADTILEDRAGNSIAKPFEVDVFRPVTSHVKTETVSVPFTVAAAAAPK